VRNVDTGQIHEFERTHAEAGAVAQDAVDLAERRNAFLDDPQRLGAEAAPGVIDDESRRVGGTNRLVADAARELCQGIADPGLGQQTTFISGTGLKK
jgi:hypothetical protein